MALVVLLAAAGGAAAGPAGQRPGAQYSPPGLYNPVIYKLDSGLRVILKSRRHIRSVSVRAAVGVGQAHYPCGQQQVPHFLEHMLFAAIPGMSESDFEQQMFDIGADSNAFTNMRDTVYTFTTYSENTPTVLQALSRLLFAGKLNRQSFDRTKAVIRRESGGEPNLYEQWLQGTDQKTSAAELALRDLSARYFGVCPGVDTGKDVTFDQVRRAYARYYAPDNTTLILVGDFGIGQAKRWVRDAFAGVGSKREAHTASLPAVSQLSKAVYRGVSDQPGVGIVAKTGGYLGPDFYARVLMQHYLNNRLYQRLRVQTGLTYTPSVGQYSTPDSGLFGISAELPEASQPAALKIIHQEIGRLTGGKLDEATFRKARRSLLLNWAQSTETNAAFADFYADSLAELDRYGRFRNEEVAVAALTADDLTRVARRVFAEGNVATLYDSSFNDRVEMVIAGAGGLLLLAVLVLGGWLVRRRRRRARIGA